MRVSNLGVAAALIAKSTFASPAVVVGDGQRRARESFAASNGPTRARMPISRH